MVRSLFVAAAAAACAVAPVRGMYFYVVEGQQRCFIEEVPQDTLVLGTYKNPDFKPFGTEGFTETGIRILVTDPGGSVVLQKVADTEGRFAFTSMMGGEHSLCLSTNNTRWFGEPRQFKFDLKLDVGEMAIDYKEVAKKEHLGTLEVEVRKLNDKMKDITKEQEYQRQREQDFRDTSESTNARVAWWSFIQTAVVVISGTWQIMHLKAFFRHKKLA